MYDKDEVTGMLNFAPYNFWILYASIAILVITMFTTLSKVLKFGKAVSAYKPQIASIQQNVQRSAVKAQAVAGRMNQIMSIVKPAIAALSLLLAAKALYDKREESGISGFTKATSDVIAGRASKRGFVNAVRKGIGI